MELFMKNRDFDKWLSTMNDSIATWKYYTDFEKVYKNAEKIKTEIYILNSLINSKNIREDFKKLLLEYPQIENTLLSSLYLFSPWFIYERKFFANIKSSSNTIALPNRFITWLTP